MRPHFFKVHSRLGMINVPNGGTELNLGVENGPDAVLDEKFLAQFPGAAVDDFRFPLPEEVPKGDYLKIMADKSRELADIINRHKKDDEIQVVVGGDHSVAFSSVMAAMDRHPTKGIAYLHFDSHGDIHLHKTSPSGNFHGMWLRPYLDGFDVVEIDDVANGKFGAQQLLFVGNLELEDEEARFFRENSVADITSQNISDDKTVALQRFKDFVSSYEHIHVSFDIDVFDRGLVSATGTPASNGMSKEEVFPFLELLRDVKSKSIDLVEVNPQKPNSKPTIELGQEVLAELLH